MKLTTISSALVLALAPLSTIAEDRAAACYDLPLPIPSTRTQGVNLTTPWAQPFIQYPNGTTCCSSIEEVRAGINSLNDQILALLAQRAEFVREATRFKATIDSVDVPARDKEVVEKAVAKAKCLKPKLPAVIARAVFEAIINASVPFEKCVWEAYLD
ncbi:hypothetical protein DSL72_002918 [Monilinia vaccinii-corymbosi]|uniref:Chorismate mutase domain-containing protein n=1 Tax=Monilinia vaccinii-corymbosi TaxID=61207 RepID=A0A8A3PE19_9HELO|nr:hypothetical protein DSL72_002918 [Monilinia vaccinii-corymbosi]